MVIDGEFKITGMQIREVTDESGTYLNVSFPGYESVVNGEQRFKAFYGPADNDNARDWWINVAERKMINAMEMLESSGINSITVKAELPGTISENMEANVRPYSKEDSQIRGFGLLTIAKTIMIDNIKIMAGKNDPDKLYVTMPSYKTNQTDENGKPKYQDYCYPVSGDFRERLMNSFIGGYNNALQKESAGPNISRALGSVSRDYAKFIKTMGAAVFYKEDRNLIEFDSFEDIDRYNGQFLCSYDECNYYEDLAARMGEEIPPREAKKEEPVKEEKVKEEPVAQEKPKSKKNDGKKK
ncbi:MAG: septation protein SpoVG family protein [Lachnospiraceae bacterium]|nr:septation protein SpoVG family protein [Lachnospiraceae bacterium]